MIVARKAGRREGLVYHWGRSRRPGGVRTAEAHSSLLIRCNGAHITRDGARSVSSSVFFFFLSSPDDGLRQGLWRITELQSILRRSTTRKEKRGGHFRPSGPTASASRTGAIAVPTRSIRPQFSSRSDTYVYVTARTQSRCLVICSRATP